MDNGNAEIGELAALFEKTFHVDLGNVYHAFGRLRAVSYTHLDVYKRQDRVIVLSEYYFKGCLLRRNDFMLEHSCGVIAFYDGKPYGCLLYTSVAIHIPSINTSNDSFCRS